MQGKRIASIRKGHDFEDTTPEIKYNMDDHLGSSNLSLDENGTLVNREEYYPLGETSFGSYSKKRYRFCGKEKDEESGLYYYGARYYSPWTCRFISVDPQAGKYIFQTPYAYADNNPICKMDYNGEGTDEGGVGNSPAVNVNSSSISQGQSSEQTNSQQVTGAKPPTKKFSKNTLDNALENASEGLKDSEDDKKGRSCGMCCLNALVSNLKQILHINNIKTGDTIDKTMADLEKMKLSGREVLVAPTNNGERVTSKKGGTVNDNTKTNVPNKLIEMTENKEGIFFFAVGIAAGYHSTIVAVVTDGSSFTDASGKTSVGTVKDPLFVYIEDMGGSKLMNKEELGNVIRKLQASAQRYYNGHKVENKVFGNTKADISIDTSIWQLYNNPKPEFVKIQKTPFRLLSPSTWW